ncbi:MAG: TetR family transcriptional regulator [Alphaproteobacteria bacterium]
MSSRSSKKPERKPGTKRANTRAQLIDAAWKLFRENGISATSLEEVAAQAGMTKGAIYGNFENKDDLVFAVAMNKLPVQRPVFRPGLSLEKQVAQLADQAIARSKEAIKHLAFMSEMDLYALTHEGLRERMGAFARARYEQVAADIKASIPESELPMPALEFTVVIYALFNSLTYQRAVLPDIVTDKTFARTMALLLRR